MRKICEFITAPNRPKRVALLLIGRECNAFLIYCMQQILNVLLIEEFDQFLIFNFLFFKRFTVCLH